MPTRKKPAANASLPTPPIPKGEYDLSPPGNIAKERLGPPAVQQLSQSFSLINPAAVYLYRQARFAPISYLTPESLSSQLSEWNVGTMRRFSLTMDAIENRDALTKSSTGKLKMSLSRRDYEIVKVEGADDAEADAHAEALNFFYSHVEATNAIDRNLRGGFGTLVHQMMDAALKKYAVHEIVWKPVVAEDGDLCGLSATFIFVPLWFFENRTGALRFAGNFAWDGIPLKDGQWMVTVGDGIMEAISVSWMYKTIALRDLLIYSERNGMPLPIGKTPHTNNSPGWTAMKDAIESIGVNSSILIGIQDEIDKLEFGASGQLPQPILIDYCDKVISALARGADLGTLSSGAHTQGTGASLQGEETELIEMHNGQMITETLNHYVDPQILRWTFGENVIPKAYVKLNIPKPKDTKLEILVDQFLVSCGVKLSVHGALERYGRAEAADGEETLSVPEQNAVQATGFGEDNLAGVETNGSGRMAANAQGVSKIFIERAKARLAKDTSLAVKPLLDKLRAIAAMTNADGIQAALKKLKDDLPVYLRKINRTPDNAAAMQEIMGAMVLNGLVSTPAPRRAANEKPDPEKIVVRTNGHAPRVTLDDGTAANEDGSFNLNLKVRNGRKRVKLDRDAEGAVIGAEVTEE